MFTHFYLTISSIIYLILEQNSESFEKESSYSLISIYSLFDEKVKYHSLFVHHYVKISLIKQNSELLS